jgi:hypothetical protein
MQVAGRAGRGLLGGQVVLQTYQPDHYVIQAAAKHDYDGFYQQEIAYRRELGYPPFRKLARMVFRYGSDIQAQGEAERAAGILRARLASAPARPRPGGRPARHGHRPRLVRGCRAGGCAVRISIEIKYHWRFFRIRYNNDGCSLITIAAPKPNENTDSP